MQKTDTNSAKELRNSSTDQATNWCLKYLSS